MAKTMQEIIAAKKQQLKAQQGGFMETVKPPAGKSTWRILPGWREDEPLTFWHDYAKHFVKTSVKGKAEAIILCDSKTFGAKCEVCEAIATARRMANDAQKTILKESNASQRYLLNALHIDGPADMRNTPQVLEIGNQLFEQLLSIASEYDDFVDLEEGTDMVITREGTGMNTEYKMTPARRSKAVDPSVMEKINNLDELLEKEKGLGDPGKLESDRAAATAALGSVIGLEPPAAGSPAAAALESKPVSGALPADFDEDIDDSAFDMDEKEAKSIDAEIEDSGDSLDDELDGLDDLLDLDDVV